MADTVNVDTLVGTALIGIWNASCDGDKKEAEGAVYDLAARARANEETRKHANRLFESFEAAEAEADRLARRVAELERTLELADEDADITTQHLERRVAELEQQNAELGAALDGIRHNGSEWVLERLAAITTLQGRVAELEAALREIRDSGVPGREFRSPLAFVIHLQGIARKALAGDGGGA